MLKRKIQISLSIYNLWILFSTIFLLAIGLGYLLFSYTPLRYYIVGKSGNCQQELTRLNTDFNRLKNHVLAQDIYLKNLGAHGEDSINVQQSFSKIDIDSLIKATKSTDSIGINPQEDSIRNRVFQSSSMNLKERRPLFTSTDTEKNEQVGILMDPCDGVIAKHFNPNHKHLGIDLVGKKNAPIYAVATGIVLEADWTLTSGHTIILQHEDDVMSIYKHNNANLVKKGDHVEAGMAIAIMGNTGIHTTGPHLHFELWKSGEALNPIHYLLLKNSLNH